jgi:aspartyl-tRNA(Asn)/glutamyl-tRNA(Gln) amidotransferase subunit B
MEYEAVIGLEVHVQLKTKSKMFTDAPAGYGAEPNSYTDSVVLALPGALPVLNKEAIKKTVQAGLLLNCQIAEISRWDRKNYFYPDSPKNYQITQAAQPLCVGGEVEIELLGASRNVMGDHRMVKLNRIHLEEDVGKLTHFENDSIVDYNRAGTPLIEIVTEPDMHNEEEVFAYLTSLRNILVNAGISDCDMEKGQLRCDANISVRKKGETELGTKVEIKNLNTITGVKNGVAYEIQRQIEAIENGETIIQETRRWNPEGAFTSSMRTKENAHDYRYFPDPDLMPVKLDKEWVADLKRGLPESPFDKQRRYMSEWDLPYTITSVLTPDGQLSQFFEEAVAIYNKPKAIANWITNDLLRELSAAGENGSAPLSESLVRPAHIADFVKLCDEGVISNQIAKDIFPEVWATGKMPSVIVEEKGLKQSSDTGELESICQQAINDSPKAVEEFKAGQEKAINAIKGKVMKATKGKANPLMVDEITRKLLA